MRILVIESEPELCAFLKIELEAQSYFVDAASDSILGKQLATKGAYALVLLDVALAGADLSLLKAIRRVKSFPILVLTARDKVKDRLQGLQQGADDYLVKPFTLTDLHARVQVLLARSKQEHSTYIRLADLEIDLARRMCARDRTLLDLTRTEFNLLTVLLRRRGQILSRDTLRDQVWGGKLDCEANVVEVAIGRLRNKLDGPFKPNLLHTVRGAGYVLEDRSETQSSDFSNL